MTVPPTLMTLPTHDNCIGVVMAVLILAYLVFALLFPERF
jgi:K+-transporting ATPase KdpF subunit